MSIANRPSMRKSLKKVEDNFRIERPDPKFEYFVDYAVFYGNGPENFDHLSDEFNVPGFLADQKWYIEGNGLAETYSHPGNLTVTLLGMNGAWAMCPIISGDGVDLARHKPPIEFETAFTPPDDGRPWNLWWTFSLFDARGKGLGQGWTPGVQNIPGQGRRYINAFAADPTRFAKSGLMNIEFDPELPRSLLQARRLAMLVQILDASHVRVGFKARDSDPWTFSKTLDTKAVFGEVDRQNRLSVPGVVPGECRHKRLGRRQLPELPTIPDRLHPLSRCEKRATLIERPTAR